MSGMPIMPDAVGYTVKELFEKIDKKLDVMSSIISSKADHADLENLRKDFDGLDTKVTKLESGVATKDAVDANERRLQEGERKANNNRTMIIVGLIGLLAQMAGTLALFLQLRH